MPSSTELARAAPHSTVTGPPHTLRAELSRMERRGEVRRMWERNLPGTRGTRIEIGFVRLKTRGEVRRARAVRIVAMVGGAAALLAGVGWLAWESRYVIMAAGVAALLALLVWWYVTCAHGCPGHHCAGCTG